MSYEGQAEIGRVVRKAAKAAHHEETDPEIDRVNNILAGEAFISALVDDLGLMITKIPTGPRSITDPEIIAGAQAVYLAVRNGPRAYTPWEDIPETARTQIAEGFIAGLKAFFEVRMTLP